MSLHELLSFVDSRNVVFSTSHLCFMSWFLSSSVVCELGILSFSKLCGFTVELGILFLEALIFVELGILCFSKLRMVC